MPGRWTRYAAGAAGPVGVLPLAGRVEALNGVRTKVVALRLQEVGGQALAAEAVVEGERGREGRRGQANEHSLRDDLPPAGVALPHGLHEVGGEQKVAQRGLGVKGLLDLSEEDGADNAPPRHMSAISPQLSCQSYIVAASFISMNPCA